MDDTESENMTETDATMTEVSKPDKPRGKCTGCDFDYQLGTARTGEHKGKLVIRKHNSRTGPGLCSGAQKPPEPTYEELEGAARETALIRVPDDVVGVAPGGTPVVADPWTAPVPALDTENGSGDPDGKLGPWVTAAFDGDCDGTSCGGRILEGEQIRADGEGGWLCEPCGEDAEIVKTHVPNIVYSDTPHEVVQGPDSTNGTLVLPTSWDTAPVPVSGTPELAAAVNEGLTPVVPGVWLVGNPPQTGEEATRIAEAVKGTAAPLHESAHSAAQQGAWTPTGTVLDRMTPEQRTEARGVSQVAYETNMRDLAQSTLPPHTVLAPDAQVTVTATAPLNIPVSIAPDPFTAPAPASDIPESTTTVSGQPEPDRDGWGRYKIHGQAHTRATTFAKLGANTKAIEAWNERNVIRGLTLRPDLLMLANGLEVKRDRDQLNSIASQAKDAAGSKVAANIGTAYHAFSERIDAGLMTLEDVPPQYRTRVQQYITKVADAGLTTRPEWIERTTAVRADQISAPLPVAGTLDRIFQMPDGSLVIGDLKTGSDLSYGEMEIEVQLALYAHGVNTHGLFDWNTKTWESGLAQPGDGLAVRTDIAIVVHLPADGDGCTLYVADIERGWRDAQRLGQLQASLKDKPRGKRFRTLMASDLAPRESLPVGPPTSPDLYPAPEPQPANDQWEHAKHLFSTAPDQATIAQLYQFALDSGKFHQDQLAVLVGLGKDRLNALARG